MLDPSVLTELWDDHADRLLLIARSVGGPAEDAVQEAFIRLARQTAVPDDPLAWLARVTRNQLLQWQRSNHRRRRREVLASGTSWFDFDIFHVDQQLDAREVTAALMTIDSPEREIIVMHLWGEMSFETIAEVVGSSRATTHRAFTRGLKTLRAKFNQQDRINTMRVCNEER